MKFWAQWAGEVAGALLRGEAALAACAEGAVPDPSAVPFPGKSAQCCPWPLSCPGEQQVLPCTGKASSGGRLHTCFSMTLSFNHWFGFGWCFPSFALHFSISSKVQVVMGIKVRAELSQHSLCNHYF